MPTEERDAALNAAIPGMNVKVGAPTAPGKLSDEMSGTDPEMDRLLFELRAAMNGRTPYGTAIAEHDPVLEYQIKMDAAARYATLREQADMARARREEEAQQRRDRELAAEKNRLEEERNRIAEAEIAGKLELEQQRIDIAKAQVVVDAMARIGADPEMRKQFGPMLEALGQRLLSGTDIGVSDGETTKLRLISAASKPANGG